MISNHPISQFATAYDPVEQSNMATRNRGTKINGLQVIDIPSSMSETSTKKSRDGVVLVPRPGDDPRDPLVCLLYYGYANLEYLI